MLYVKGDIHGNIWELANACELAHLTREDYLVVVGDCGIPFGVNAPHFDVSNFRGQVQELGYLNYNVVFVAGNHDDYDFIEQLPKVTKFNNDNVRQMAAFGKVIDNVWYINEPGVYDIAGKHCLIVPGADSHDIWNGVLDPEDPDFEETLDNYIKHKGFFRVKHWSWWPQEAIKIDYIKEYMPQWIEDHFDLVLTHDCPTEFMDWNFNRYPTTDGEKALQWIYNMVPFDMWFHGHMHQDRWYKENIACIYWNYVNVDEMDGYDRNLLWEFNEEDWKDEE